MDKIPTPAPDGQADTSVERIQRCDFRDAHGHPLANNIGYIELLKSHEALLNAAKLAVMNSADLRSDCILGEAVASALNDAITLAGGFTEEEQERLEDLALGEDEDERDAGVP